jgi:RNA polymerase sigma factor (sigma-70 family)
MPELAHSEVKTNASDELDVVHASKRGNLAAFETLVKRYDRKLLRIASSVTHRIEDSQGAVQEAFSKAYLHLAEFREACQFSTWLIRNSLNQSLMKLRRQRRRERPGLTSPRNRESAFRVDVEWTSILQPSTERIQLTTVQT